ncbi:epoxide hydrolase family protein [Kribbella sp. NPDC051620]|uniref:epoxide hydrolase family protein n=1 Tax=Kribbella sp. NPDC051620 TaxID=3364120 RepID=UPI00379B5CAB
MSIESFRVEISQAEVDELRRRLEVARWPEGLPGVGWAYGVPVEYLRELAEYWRDGYDWRAAEGRLNEWEQFTTVIDGARVHFVHLRSPEADATPLLVTHGWPGSVVEFQEIAGPLTDPQRYGVGGPAFHLVMPSIPGFTLSGPTREAGWEQVRVARAFAELMARLGYERYGVQGGDWGAAISREIGRLYPERVIGVHLNLIPGAGATSEPTEDELAVLDPKERERTVASWQRFAGWLKESQGYAELQSTRPQTVAYALTDSPVGQLAWIAEKFEEWSGDDPIDRDHLLTNVSLYWFTRTAGSAGRIYYERSHAAYWGQPLPVSTAPTGFADFPEDNFIPLRHIAERTNNIVRWTEYPRGGHFAALEVPDLLVTDIRAFFASL